MYGIIVHFYMISIIQKAKPNIFPNILCAASANPFSRSNSGKVGEMDKDNKIQLQIVVHEGWCSIIHSLLSDCSCVVFTFDIFQKTYNVQLPTLMFFKHTLYSLFSLFYWKHSEKLGYTNYFRDSQQWSQFSNKNTSKN